MGFCDRWVALMMSCVKTVSYFIIVNGEPTGMIYPKRGIRPGHPLSPFIFLVCTEGLPALLKHSARLGDIKGFSLCKQGPKLTHLFFADYSFVRDRAPGPFYEMLGQTHVNGWSRVIASQNGGSTSYIFPLRLGVLQWSPHLFNYWKNKKTII